MEGRTVLIIDDDVDLVQLLAQACVREGAKAYVAHDGRSGLREFYKHSPDLVMLDILMPIMGGWQVFRSIREVSDVPVLILSVLDEEEQVIRGLEAGAVDYVPKPFSLQVLLARARAALRMPRPPAPQGKPIAAYDDGYLRIDLDHAQVSVCGEPLHLTDTEYRILAFLVENSGQVMSGEEILAAVWGKDYTESRNYVYLYLWRLRSKLKAHPDSPTYLDTVRGAGYRFVAQAGRRVGGPPE